MNKGVAVKMLILAPESESIKWRAGEIFDEWGADEDALKYDLEVLLNRLRKLAGPGPSRNIPWNLLEVRTYHGIPGLPMLVKMHGQHVVEAYTSYFLSKPSHHMPYFHWREGEFGAYLKTYFEKKWAGGTSVV